MDYDSLQIFFQNNNPLVIQKAAANINRINLLIQTFHHSF
jgi:hypothetical protein